MNSTTEPEITVLAQYKTSLPAIPSGPHIHVIQQPTRQAAESARNIFVLAQATELSEVAKFVSLANRRHQLRVLFVHEDVDAHWIPQLFERAGLRTLRNALVHSDMTLPGRVLRAWANEAQDDLIADATVVRDRLFVTSCALRQYEVPIDRITPLKSLPESTLGNFEIDEDGSYLHWPEHDIHLGLDAIRAAIDPDAHRKAQQMEVLHDQRYGKAIAIFRKKKGLTQSEIPGLSDRQVRRIENGEGTSSESLQKLASAHRMSLKDYLDELARLSSSSETDLTFSAEAGGGGSADTTHR